MAMATGIMTVIMMMINVMMMMINMMMMMVMIINMMLLMIDKIFFEHHLCSPLQGLDQGLVASLLSMRGDLRGWGLGNIQETEDETLV